MRISDWSSDVCSSDLRAARGHGFIAFDDESNEYQMPIHGEQQEGRKNRKESADYRARLPALRIGHAGETKTHGVADDFASHEGGGIADLQCKTDSKLCKHLASEIGRAHVGTPVHNAHIVSRRLRETKKNE